MNIIKPGPIRAFNVWKIDGNNGLKRYRCFEDCSTH
jgi:hypothetical protein